MDHFLRTVPLFAGLPVDDLNRICALSREIRLEPKELLFSEGDPGDSAYVIREGELEVLKIAGGREVLLAVRHAGDLIGEMSLLDDAPRMATARARTAVVVVSVGSAAFDELVQTSPTAARALLQLVTERLRGTEAKLRHGERMAQLGTMTAGLAHELNNPAAAARRGAEQLRGGKARLLAVAGAWGASLPSPEENRALESLLQAAAERATKPGDLDPLTRSDREAALEEVLEGLGVADPWDHAAPLVAAGFLPDQLEADFRTFERSRVGLALEFVAQSFAIDALLHEIHHASSRLADLVAALKRHVRLDQAPVQVVDVQQSIDDALLLLSSKLRDGVRVIRRYASAPPTVEGWGSELNQVWTNIIDNAIDALGGRGTLIISTAAKAGVVSVEIEDDGPGMKEEVQARIFDPFFTTKAPGKGTGLGLNTSWNIVVGRHRGELAVESQPGRTVFRVRLPRDASVVLAPSKGAERVPDARLKKILEDARTIAVVGASDREGAPAHDVPRYLEEQGYRILPVNPRHEEVLGKKSHPNLDALPETPDVVLVFRRSEAAGAVTEQAIARGAKVVWMPEGVFDEAAAQKCQAAGVEVVMDTCMRNTHRRLMD